jgi:lipoprotein signal peptidase
MSKVSATPLRRVGSVALMTVVVDQATKVLARAVLVPCVVPRPSTCEPVVIAGPVGFLRIENGGAFGIVEDVSVWLALSMLASIAVGSWRSRDHRALWRCPSVSCSAV